MSTVEIPKTKPETLQEKNARLSAELQAELRKVDPECIATVASSLEELGDKLLEQFPRPEGDRQE